MKIYEILKSKKLIGKDTESGRVIDVGSGDGNQGKEFEAAGFEVTYIEKKDGLDAITYEYPEEVYDIAIANNSLPFMGLEQEKVVNGIYRALKTGGVFYGTVFGFKDPWSQNETVRAVDFDKFRTFLLLKGFKVVWYSEEFGIHPKDSDHKLKDWHIMRFIAVKQ